MNGILKAWNAVLGRVQNVNAKQNSLQTIGDMGTGFGIAQNRFDAAPFTSGPTRQSMTFPAGLGPTKINIRLTDATGAGLKLFAVVNAISDTHADAELAAPPSQDSTTERYTVVETGEQPAGLDISSLTPIDRIDYITDATDATANVVIEGA